MRAALAIASLVLPLALTACGGGDSPADRADRVCPLMGRLRESAEILAEADIADPDQFLGALDDAVAEYVTTVEGLLEVAPEDLHDDLTTLRAAVEQLRFDDAIAARAPLDEYARRHCEVDDPGSR